VQSVRALSLSSLLAKGDTLTVLYSFLASNALVPRIEVGSDPGAEALGIGPGRHVVALQLSPKYHNVVSSYVDAIGR